MVEDVALNKRKMKNLEDTLLNRLSSTEGSIIEDVSLIDVLNTTKKTSEDVSQKLINAANTEAKINAAREEFRTGEETQLIVTGIGVIFLMTYTDQDIDGRGFRNDSVPLDFQVESDKVLLPPRTLCRFIRTW